MKITAKSPEKGNLEDSSWYKLKANDVVMQMIWLHLGKRVDREDSILIALFQLTLMSALDHETW